MKSYLNCNANEMPCCIRLVSLKGVEKSGSIKIPAKDDENFLQYGNSDLYNAKQIVKYNLQNILKYF